MTGQIDMNEVREKIEDLLGELTIANDTCFTFGEAIDCIKVFTTEILSLIQPLIEEAKQEVAREIIGRIENLNSIGYAYGAEYKVAILEELKSHYLNKGK
ncbi:hypothetical protein ES708_23111 [subsurface metagenome]